MSFSAGKLIFMSNTYLKSKMNNLNMTGAIWQSTHFYCVVLDFVTLKDKNPFESHPSNEILVPFRVFFENFRRAPRHFYMGVPPGDSGTFYVFFKNFRRAPPSFLYGNPPPGTNQCISPCNQCISLPKRLCEEWPLPYLAKKKYGL